MHNVFTLKSAQMLISTSYPGVGCDVPAHSYTFPFESNSEWNGFYANGGQIQQYFLDFCEKYDLRRFMRFETTVIGATWLEEEGECSLASVALRGMNELANIGKGELELRSKGGSKFFDRCTVLISGSGPLNQWKCKLSFREKPFKAHCTGPDIKGIDNYKGTLVHTADWKADIDWQGQRVAVIGSGSSGVQILPHLAKGKRNTQLSSHGYFQTSDSSTIQAQNPWCYTRVQASGSRPQRECRISESFQTRKNPPIQRQQASTFIPRRRRK